MFARLSLVFVILAFAAAAAAQDVLKYNYDAQKAFIPEELGEVYLGMPFNEFAKNFDLSAHEAGDHRFGYLPVEFPLNKGNVLTVRFKVHGLKDNEKKGMLVSATVTKNTDADGDPVEPWERSIERLDASKIPDKGFVYEITVMFKPDFDQKAYAIKTFGKNGTVRASDDEYNFYDIQWTPKTSDGLTWMVRSFHEGNSRELRLIGIIDKTEWDPNR